MKRFLEWLKTRTYGFSWGDFGFNISPPKEEYIVNLVDLLKKEKKWARENPAGLRFSEVGPFDELPVHLMLFGLVQTLQEACWLQKGDIEFRQEYVITHLAYILEWLKDQHSDLSVTEYDVLCGHVHHLWETILETDPEEGRKIVDEYSKRNTPLQV